MKDLPLPVIKEGLERRYRECLTLEPSFDLVIALHNYVQQINDHPILDYLFTEKIQAEARTLSNQIKEEEVKAEEELNAIFDKLSALIKKKAIDNPAIDGSLTGFKNFRDKRVISSMGRVESMSRELRDVISALYHTDHKELITEYIVESKAHGGILRFNLGKAMQLHEFHKNKFQKLSGVSAWGAFEIIFISYRAIQSYADDYSEDQIHTSLFDDVRFISSAAQALSDEESGLRYQKPEHSAKSVFFRNYSKAVLGRLHLALLDELDKYEQSKARELPKKLHERVDTADIMKSFNKQGDGPQVSVKNGNGYFRFNKKGHPIDLGKAKNQPYRLLEILVADPIEGYKKVEDIFYKVWGNKYDKKMDAHGNGG
jgi:hypothetical protein